MNTRQIFAAALAPTRYNKNHTKKITFKINDLTKLVKNFFASIRAVGNMGMKQFAKEIWNDQTKLNTSTTAIC